MALSITENLREHWGRKRVVFLTLAFDSSYPTGGEAFTAAQFDLGRIDWIMASPKSGYQFEWDETNSKLLAYYVDNNAASDSAMIQVPDTTNLSTLTGVRVMVVGS